MPAINDQPDPANPHPGSSPAASPTAAPGTTPPPGGGTQPTSPNPILPPPGAPSGAPQGYRGAAPVPPQAPYTGTFPQAQPGQVPPQVPPAGMAPQAQPGSFSPQAPYTGSFPQAQPYGGAVPQGQPVTVPPQAPYTGALPQVQPYGGAVPQGQPVAAAPGQYPAQSGAPRPSSPFGDSLKLVWRSFLEVFKGNDLQVFQSLRADKYARLIILALACIDAGWIAACIRVNGWNLVLGGSGSLMSEFASMAGIYGPSFGDWLATFLIMLIAWAGILAIRTALLMATLRFWQAHVSYSDCLSIIATGYLPLVGVALPFALLSTIPSLGTSGAFGTLMWGLVFFFTTVGEFTVFRLLERNAVKPQAPTIIHVLLSGVSSLAATLILVFAAWMMFDL